MTIKRLLGVTFAVILAVSCLLCGGCSTPDIAMQVGSKSYTMGEYLAYMYNTMYTDSTSYTYFYYYGEEAFDQKVTYGANAEVITLSDYIIRTTKDQIIRQKALEDLMKENNIGFDPELLEEVTAELAELKPDQFLQFGFNNDRYIAMYKAVQLNESSLFLGLYDKGGVREVSKEAEQTWFDEHYFSYKSFELSLVDKDGKDLPEEEKTAIQAQMNGYLKLYEEKGKTAAAFDEVYRQYLADVAKAEEADKDDEKTENEGDSTNSTDVDADELDEEKEEIADRIDLIDSVDGILDLNTGYTADEELFKAVKTIGEGEAAIKEYQKGGTAKTLALILRMDPEAERGKDDDGNDIDFFADQHETTLYYMKNDEFTQLVNEKVAAVTAQVTVNERAIKAAKPKDMWIG